MDGRDRVTSRWGAPFATKRRSRYGSPQRLLTLQGRRAPRAATAYFCRGAGGPATAARGPNEQLLDREDRAVHLQLRRPRAAEDRRLGRGQEQPRLEASAANDARRLGAGLSHGRREGRGGRGPGHVAGLSRPETQRSEARRGGPEGRGEAAAARAAGRD